MEKHIKLKVFEILMDTRLADIIFMLVKLSLSLKEDLQLEWRKESNTLSKLLGRLVKDLCLKALIVLIIWKTMMPNQHLLEIQKQKPF